MAMTMDVAQLPTDVQELLSEGGGFVLCDAKVCPKTKGLPIRAVSEAFLNLLGYEDASECVGQGWHEVLSGACDSQEDSNEAILKDLGATGLSTEKTAEALRALSSRFREVAVGLTRSGKSSATALALARRSGATGEGSVFVCQLTMRVQLHPVLGWAYVVGLHRDISNEVSPAQLLSAVLSSGDGDPGPAAGVDPNGERFAKSCALLDGPNVQGFLNGRAGEMWQTAMAEQMRGKNLDEKKAVRRAGGAGRSVASASTAASRRSAASRASTRSADTEWDQEASRALYQETQQRPAMHLGALLSVPMQAPQKRGIQEEASPTETFHSQSTSPLGLDLLEDVSGSDNSDFVMAPRLSLQQSYHGAHDRSPLPRLAELGPAALTPNSDSLQEVIETMGKKELRDLDFPFVLADPSRPGCPLIVCSAGFSGLTGYSAWEALGRSAEFGVYGVPDRLIRAEQTNEVKKLLECASNFEYYPSGVCDDVVLADGELVAVQTHTRRSGELFRCMTLLKQVELEEKMFVVGLQARVADPSIDPEEHHEGDSEESDGSSSRHTTAFNQLSKNLDIAVHVLASQFWFSAPMRRQFAISSDSETEQ